MNSVRVDSQIPGVTSDSLLPFVRLSAGDTYDGDAVQKSVEALTREVARRGFAFAEVKPRGDRNGQNHTVSIAFNDRRRPARLHRAHQRARQHPHARIRHPPRVRYRRRRPLQQGADRQGRAPPEQPRLLQEGQDHQPARLLARSRHRRRRRRGPAYGILRRVGRLLDLGRLHRRALGFGIQLPRPRPVREGRHPGGPERPRHRFLLHRALHPRHPHRGRLRPLRQAERQHAIHRLPDLRDRRHLAARRADHRRVLDLAALFDLQHPHHHPGHDRLPLQRLYVPGERRHAGRRRSRRHASEPASTTA